MIFVILHCLQNTINLKKKKKERFSAGPHFRKIFVTCNICKCVTSLDDMIIFIEACFGENVD